MQLTKLMPLLVLGLSLSAHAALYNYSSRPSVLIPGANVAGWSDITTFSGLSRVTQITVTLNIGGGYNGNLYAYLSHGGGLLPLLNRVGVGTAGSHTAFGYSDAGMNITLGDSGAHNIHFYQDVTGSSITDGTTWQPDGRLINPLSAAGDFNANGTVNFSTLGAQDGNGSWTLFLADLSGGNQSTLNSWSLSITAVPEPVNVALGLFGVVFARVTAARWRLNRKTGSA
jgi:subtilisin-like proprotein convertase family protein